jgi:hypothetical protein
LLLVCNEKPELNSRFLKMYLADGETECYTRHAFFELKFTGVPVVRDDGSVVMWDNDVSAVAESINRETSEVPVYVGTSSVARGPSDLGLPETLFGYPVVVDDVRNSLGYGTPEFVLPSWDDEVEVIPADEELPEPIHVDVPQQDSPPKRSRQIVFAKTLPPSQPKEP